jgi:uncharacterized protein
MAQVVIDDALKASIEALPAEPGKPETSAAFTQLAKMGFLVSAQDEDDKAIEDWFARMRADDSILRPTVLTTYACNFACTYCVEEGVKQAVFMSDETAMKTTAYIIKKQEEYGSKRIHLNFYGGEPLLNVPAIRVVAKALHDHCTRIGMPFTFTLSTNGSLLTAELVSELKPLGLSGAKITLDGPKETHDRSRPFKNGRPSFDLLISNIRASAELTDFVIEVNFDQGNTGRVGELLDQLTALGLREKIKRILFSPVSATPRDREGLVPAAEIECALLSTETAHGMVELTRMAAEKGFNVQLGVVAHSCELVSKRSSFIIDPRGNLCRCGGLAGRSEFGFGSIGGEKNDPYLGQELWRRCAQCAYVPLCGDGCPFGAYVRYGDPLKLNCGKEALDYLVPESLKLAYLQKSRKPAS